MFATTIRKSQGETLGKVGLYLKSPVFAHGQLYVALSRVSSSSDLVIEAALDSASRCRVRNVVYKDVLTSECIRFSSVTWLTSNIDTHSQGQYTAFAIEHASYIAKHARQHACPLRHVLSGTREPPPWKSLVLLYTIWRMSVTKFIFRMT